jgi:sugar lactone lactonase YvrE
VYDTGNSGLPDNGVSSLAVDSQGNLWIGTKGGLAKFDGARWEVYTRSNSGLPDNWVSSLAVDLQGNLWIGTYEGGLARFDGENWAVYKTGNSGLPDNWVLSLAVDSQGNLWIGTEGGLARFGGESWEVYDTGNSGLPDNWVGSLAVDSQGNLWIGTEGGLAVYREGGVILPGITAVGEELDTRMPSAFSLSQNYPNPFNPTTTIEYDLPEASGVTLAIYNTTGQCVTTLVSKHQTAGRHAVCWDASGCASGLYFYRLWVGRFTQTGRMVHLK